MSKLSNDEVARIARLAYITLKKEEEIAVTEKLQSILGFVDDLQSVDMSGIDPTSQVTGLVDVLREDVVERCKIPRDELLARAPMHEDGHIKVKRVIK